MATIVVTGLDKIQRDLARSVPAVSEGLRVGLREAAEPVKRDAETLARTQIPGMRRAAVSPAPWSEMRIGVTQRAVYVAPRQRRRTNQSLRRPNLFDLIMNRSFEPALDRNMAAVEATVDRAITLALRDI